VSFPNSMLDKQVPYHRRVPSARSDAIDYVATDTSGNTSTSTRTVIVEASSKSTVQ
jgi:hypothetical protein